MKNQITYVELIEMFVMSLFANESSHQKIKNFRSAINSWLRALNLDLKSPVGDELRKNFNSYIGLYEQHESIRSLESSTRGSMISRIKKIRIFFMQQLEEPLNQPESFHERLSYFIKLRSFSISGFWRAFLQTQISRATLHLWCCGTVIPRRRSQPILDKIELLLKLKKGMLLSTLVWYKIGDLSCRPTTEFRKLLKILTKKKYYTWTETLEKEFAGLVEFKTAIIPPYKMKRLKRATWTSSEGALLPSANKVRLDFKSFFGFCGLAKDNPDPMMRGLGIEKEKLTLALLTESEIVEKYLTEFKPSRTNKKFNQGYLTFIATLTSCLRKETGYLYQKPELARRLGLSLSTEQWQDKCLTTRRRLLEIKEAIEEAKRTGSSDFEFGRDPQEPISKILNHKHPLSITMTMVTRMLEDAETLSAKPSLQAVLFRDALLISLLQANPLRIKMFRIMKFDEHLIRESDGSWWLNFKRNTLKNRYSVSTDYKVRLSQEVWWIIEKYKKEFRPRLYKADDSQYVFLPRYNSPSKKLKKGIEMGACVFKRTQEYIPGGMGFGPHSFRHIVATSIIKSNPEFGFFLAAKVLNDKLETVERCYAHLRTNEFIEPYNRLFTTMWKVANSNSQSDDDKMLGKDSEGGEFRV